MMRHFLFCAVGSCVASALTSCGGTGYLQAESAGHVGCAPDEIVIRDNRLHAYHRTWSALCEGKLFRCTADQSGHTSCSEQTKPLLQQ